MSSSVPDGWEETNLSSLVSVDIESLKGNTDPDYKFKYIDISCVSTGSVTPPSQYILFQNAPSRAKRVVRQNDVLIATVRPNLKAFAHFDEEGEDWVASTGFAVLRNKEWADSRFIFNVMLSDDVSGQIDKLVVGSNYPAINSSDVKDLTVLSPPLPEQKKIASILTSVDEVIENTQKQIDKLQDLKKATMNELLTKGIGHTEFKDSELGRIPKSWEVVPIHSVTSFIKSGLSRRLSSQDIGIPVINSGNIVSRELDTKKLKYWYLNDPQGANIENYLLQDGDILLNFINSVSQIGKSCIYKSIGRDCIYTTNLFCIRVGNKISSSFLHSLMSQERFGKEISLITKPAINQASFTKEDLSNLIIVLPTLEEQNLIINSLDAIDENINNHRQKLETFQSLKKSLMQDLLTGKVRVTVH